MHINQTQRSASVGANGKNIAVAYALWWFLGFFGIHRFYLARPKTGLAQVLLLALGWLPLFLGWIILGIWWLIDAYFVYKYTSDHNAQYGGDFLGLVVTTGKSVGGDLDHLERLHSLKEKGVLTENEYRDMRKEVLN